MEIFNGLKNKIKNNYFNIWLDNILKNDLPNDIVAINFNLYEEDDNTWSIELIGASSFDENNTDWACEEVFSTRDNLYTLVKKSDYAAIELIFSNLIKDYIINGKYCDKLTKYAAIGIGFVDGDLSILYKNDKVKAEKYKKNTKIITYDDLKKFNAVKIATWLSVYLKKDVKEKTKIPLISEFEKMTDDELDKWIRLLADNFDYKKYNK